MRTKNTLRTLMMVVLGAAAISINAQQLIPTEGKEFWLGFMRNYQLNNDGNALKLYISSNVSTSGTASAPLQGWSVNFNVTAGVVTTVDVPLNLMHDGSEAIDTKGIFVQTQDTVAVYALNFENFTTDAGVIYPTKSLGTDYRVHAFYGLDGFGTLNSELLVVATADGTQVVITPTVNTVGGHLANVPFTVNLDQGQSYQVWAANGLDDLTGSTVRATAESGACRPFAVFGGSACPDVPTGCFACDHVFDEMLPSPFWGTSYFSVPWQTTTAYLYRILANQDGTHVSVDGGPPVTLNAGQFNEVSGTNVPHCFSGDLPFSVAEFMEGNSCSGGNSDPALLVLNAQEQKINDITFAAVISANITQQFINVVVDIADIGNVTLDASAVPPGQFTPFTACPDHAFASLPLTQGSHRISCPNGLTGYVYGLGPNYETYAYSVGSFTPLPALNFDTVFCGLDTTDFVTLSPPAPVFNPYWTTESDPNDTLFQGLVYTFQPDHSDVWVLTGTENVSGCTQQYFFSVELGAPPVTTITVPPSVCAYTSVPLQLSLDPPGSYLFSWTPSAGLSDPHAQNPVATPAHDTWYYVTVTTQTGCAATTDSVLVTVTPGDVLNVDAVTQPAIICVGENTQLDAHVQQIVVRDDFDLGIGSMWQQVQNGTTNTVCGSVSGNALYFDGAGNRFARTNLLNTSAGGSLSFAIKIASGLAPCEDVDPGEDILLEYTINNGVSWTIMNTFYESQYHTFTALTIPIPGPAQTVSTAFRWRQLANSGVGQDNWMLDDVAIAVNDLGNITFSWTPSATLTNANIHNPVATPPAPTYYVVDMIDQQTNCPYTDSVLVDVGPAFFLDLTNDTTLCGIDTLQLHATPDQPGGYTYNWTPNDGTLSSLSSGTPFAWPTVTDTYIVHATSQYGCQRTDTVTVTVVDSLVTTILAIPDTICAGDPVQLQVQAFQGSGSFAYVWYPPGSLNNPLIQNPIGTPGTTTFYTATVHDLQCGAFSQQHIEVTVIPLPSENIGSDLFICPGGTVSLDAGPADSWLWSTGQTSQIITVDQAGAYWVHAFNGQCAGVDTVDVDPAPQPGPLGFNVTGCAGIPLTLTIPFSPATYHWFNDSTTQSVTIDGTTGDYTFSVTDTFGCTYNDVAHVLLDPLGLTVTMPNVISPNGDGRNDSFVPMADGIAVSSTSGEVQVAVYNRYGQELFHSEGLSSVWKGKSGSSDVPAGTYFYIVRYKPQCEATFKELHGTVTVLR